MKILVVGSGGREHVLVWKISKSPLVQKIYCAPGNCGIGELAELVDIPVHDIQSLISFCKQENVDLTVVGPELPLTLGIVDEFKKHGMKIFGPSRKAAQLEGSKIFAKWLMKKYGIPTAAFEIFSEPKDAIAYLEKCSYPIVIKADGLAAGKGVLVTPNQKEACEFIEKVMVSRVFGEAGHTVVIEECLKGEEISVLALLDGKTIVPLPEARDHKRIFDHDEGPNTGGMGAYSPVPWASKELIQQVVDQVFIPLSKAFAKEGIAYHGVLYAGLMITSIGPKVLEFNVRFGDPETQVILPRIKTDLVTLMQASCEGALDKIKIEISPETALCVIVASGGYPDAYQNGFKITGLENVAKEENLMVFHAGTRSTDGDCLTSGGRVLGVTALGSDMKEARHRVYAALQKIHFEKMHYRRDIGVGKNSVAKSV